jgi:hypothetical protein
MVSPAQETGGGRRSRRAFRVNAPIAILCPDALSLGLALLYEDDIVSECAMLETSADDAGLPDWWWKGEEWDEPKGCSSLNLERTIVESRVVESV